MSDMSSGPAGPNDPAPTTSYEPPRATPPTPPTQPTAPTPPAPPWPPAPLRRRDDPGRSGTIIFGLIIIAVGLWFFADQTLGLDMPRLRWSEIWPVILIVVGGWILVASIRRR